MPSSDDRWRFAADCVWLPTAEEMSAMDQRAIQRAIPERALIENAGRALAARLHQRWPTGTVAALAGSGHNGADALVALRTLRAWGRDVLAVRCGSSPPDPDVLIDWDIELLDPERLDRGLASSTVAIDGILGTGVRDAPRAPQSAYIEALNSSDVAVVATDGPSGVNFTTGAVPGAAVRADLTVTFGWPKLGLLRFPARALCGEIEAVEIGFPPPEPDPAARLITAASAARALGRRGDDAHKGRAGYVAVVGGRAGMAGAVALAARAAIRAGAGVVRVVSASENREVIQTGVPAAVFVDWSDEEAVGDALRSSDGIAIGPGMGVDGTRARVEGCLGAAGSTPSVLDADALNAFAGDAAGLAGALAGPAVLTPHPGEMRRLLETPVDVLDDPPAAARGLSAATGATVLLKGAPTLVAEPSGALRVASLVSPAFAAGGMGDVLSGLIAAYLAAGLSPADAASSGLMVSGLATVSVDDPVGLSADDVPDRLPAARAALDTVEPGRVPGVLVALPAATSSA